MSELFDKRAHRKKMIKELIRMLHEGEEIERVKKRFREQFENVSADEISQAEHDLIEEGMPVTEVQRLCDVHAAVFEGRIEDIHKESDPSQVPGHPAHTLVSENDLLRRICETDVPAAWSALREDGDPSLLVAALEELGAIDVHYQKKENIFFPYMERYGITAPPKVMWGVDDEIRSKRKSLLAALENDESTESELKSSLDGLIQQILDMIVKEENIMLPMLVDHMTHEDWVQTYQDGREIGSILSDETDWTDGTKAGPDAVVVTGEETPSDGRIALSSGTFTVRELDALFKALPVDITFVDAEDTVRFFSQTPDRPFARTKAILGRKVSNCHPPASVHIVESIVDDFKSGRKDEESFWLQVKDRFVHIRYVAVRDGSGTYLGVVEVTQDISFLRTLTGEKRLVEDGSASAPHGKKSSGEEK